MARTRSSWGWRTKSNPHNIFLDDSTFLTILVRVTDQPYASLLPVANSVRCRSFLVPFILHPFKEDI